MSSICSSVPKFFSNNCSCRDDAALPMALSLLPIIGPVIQLGKELSLSSAISDEMINTRNVSNIIEFVKLKNKYKVCGLIRDLISMAVSIALLAAGILSPAGAFVAMIGFGIAIGIASWALSRNQHAIKALEKGNPRVTIY